MGTHSGMTPQHYARACEVFLRAVDLGGPDRQSFIDSACEGDPELRQSVEGMVRAHEQDTGPRPEQVARAAVDALTEGGSFSTDDIPSPEIPGYRIDRVLGEGGFGLVYGAEQVHPIRRPVAIKVLKPGMDSRQVLRRFEFERSTLARLDHPGICRIHDAGMTAVGLPFVVMERVDGRPIVRHCNERGVGQRGRIELVAQVAQAVEHAHRRGVIHRDIKPGNILVTESEGVPRAVVIDFGVARALGGDALSDAPAARTAVTAAGMRIGTLAYMSPEQRRGEPADTRSDVYALGVVLHELITGDLPASSQPDGAGAASDRSGSDVASQDAARTTSKPRHSKRTRLERAEIPSELRWIVRKAIDPQAERRYGSMSALERDLRRHLQGEAVEARPPDLAYRLATLVRRHKAGVVSAAAIVLTMIGATVFSLWQMRVAQAAEREASRRARVAESVTELLTHDVIRQFSPFTNGELGRQAVESGEISVETLLRSTADAARTRFADDPQTRAAVLASMGMAMVNLGKYEPAVGMLREAWLLNRSQFGRNDFRTARVLASLTHAVQQTMAFDEAVTMVPELVASAEAATGPRSRFFGAVLQLCANVLFTNRQSEEGLAMALRAIDVLEDHPVSSELVLAHKSAAQAYVMLKQYDKTEEHAQIMLELAENNMPENAAHRLNATQYMATVHMLRERYDEADRYAQRAAVAFEQLAGPTHPTTLQAKQMWSGTREKMGDVEKAIALRREVYETERVSPGMRNGGVRFNAYNLAWKYVNAQRYSEAIPIADELVDHASPAMLSTYIEFRGLCWEKLGDVVAAEQDYVKAFGATGDPKAQRRLAKNLSILVGGLGRNEEAARWATEAERLEKVPAVPNPLGPGHP